MKAENKILKNILISGAILISTSLMWYFNSDYRKKIFDSPKNLAQKVANYCAINSSNERKAFFNGGEGKGVSYEKKFIVDRTAYNVEVTSWDNGVNEMRIENYLFDGDLGEKKLSEADIVDKLISESFKLKGVGIYEDNDLDGSVDLVRIFTKPFLSPSSCYSIGNDSYSCRFGFNVDELRENLSGEKNTLSQESLGFGSSKHDGKRFQGDFNVTLEEIADHFGIEK